jgi:hypothetical protein
LKDAGLTGSRSILPTTLELLWQVFPPRGRRLRRRLGRGILHRGSVMPKHTCVSLGQGYRSNVRPAAVSRCCDPTTAGVTFAPNIAQGGVRTVNQQRSQVTIAALADAEELYVRRSNAGVEPVLARAQFAPARELSGVAHCLRSPMWP